MKLPTIHQIQAIISVPNTEHLLSYKMSSHIPASTEPPSTLKQSLAPVKVRYIPISDLIPMPGDNDLVTRTATADAPFPCRRCLQDASPGTSHPYLHSHVLTHIIGESLHLVPYNPFPQQSTSPYSGAGPIFIHAHACKPFEGDTLPETQLGRSMSVRAYDKNYMMAAANVVKGEEVHEVLGKMLADERAECVFVHNAGPGCFAVRVERAGGTKGE